MVYELLFRRTYITGRILASAILRAYGRRLLWAIPCIELRMVFVESNLSDLLTTAPK